MTPIKGIEIMMQIKAEYFYAFKDMPESLFKTKVENFNKALFEYSDEEVDTAMGIVFATNKTVPTTAHFVEVLERNRELLLPSAEEEWVKISEIVKSMSFNSKNFDISYDDWEKHREKQKSLYLSLSSDVREYYINYSSFLDVLECKLDIERSRFLKNFPVFRREKLLKEKLKAKLNG